MNTTQFLLMVLFTFSLSKAKKVNFNISIKAVFCKKSYFDFALSDSSREQWHQHRSDFSFWLDARIYDVQYHHEYSILQELCNYQNIQYLEG